MPFLSIRGETHRDDPDRNLRPRGLLGLIGLEAIETDPGQEITIFQITEGILKPTEIASVKAEIIDDKQVTLIINNRKVLKERGVLIGTGAINNFTFQAKEGPQLISQQDIEVLIPDKGGATILGLAWIDAKDQRLTPKKIKSGASEY